MDDLQAGLEVVVEVEGVVTVVEGRMVVKGSADVAIVDVEVSCGELSGVADVDASSTSEFSEQQFYNI